MRENRVTCPCCRRYVLDGGHLPYHEDDTGDECPGALLPPWAAQADDETKSA